MKWRVTSIIPIWTFAIFTLSSSTPIFIQDEMAVMYPVEYYPAYMQGDFENLDITKWFRKAADSVKHFYNYVNNLIFGEVGKEPVFGRYPTFKENKIVDIDSHLVNEVHHQESQANVNGIQAFEIYKDADGNMFLKNLNNPSGELKLLQKIPLKSDDPPVNSGIERNPFQWNENLEKDKLFSGVFQNYAVNPQVLWHSGIFPFQPLSAFNIMNGKISDQNHLSQNQSSQPSTTNVSDESENNEITSQKTEETEPPSTSTSSTTIDEQTKNYETSDSSDSSDQKTSSDDSSQYEIVMNIERIKQNDSDSDESNNVNESQPDTTESDIFETNDEDTDDNSDDDNNDTKFDDNYHSDDGDDDDGDDNLTEFETDQISSDDESSEQNQVTQEITNSEITSEKDSAIIETSAPSEGTEIARETTDAKNTENSLLKQNSDESDIEKRVLSIINISKN